MNIWQTLSNIEHRIVVGAEDAEHKIVLEIGNFKQWVEAHPTLEADLKLWFGKALQLVQEGIPALESAIAAAAGTPGSTLKSVWDVAHTGLFSLLGSTASSISSEVSNPANAISILATIGTALGQAIDSHVGSVTLAPAVASPAPAPVQPAS